MLPPSRQQKGSQNLLIFLIVILFGISIVLKIGGKAWIRNRLQDVNGSEYSYLGYDYPEAWPIERDTVLMAFDNPKHFRLDTEDGAAEWSALITGDGLVHLGSHHQPYTISMLHQLRCLDIVRNETVRNPEEKSGPSMLARHCLNYLRQMVMCRGDLELESFQFASNKNPIDMHGLYECKDWEAVYAEVRENQKQHNEWLEQRR